jgi:hypothetical protein
VLQVALAKSPGSGYEQIKHRPVHTECWQIVGQACGGARRGTLQFGDQFAQPLRGVGRTNGFIQGGGSSSLACGSSSGLDLVNPSDSNR